jgi:predicted SnoaL-like aldol condensation-catalyzing enzyme
MNIVKLASVFLLLGVTACGSSEKKVEEVALEEIKEVQEAVQQQPSCLEVGCEELNKALIQPIYNDVINGLNTGLLSTIYAENYIQHNSDIASGISGVESYYTDMTTDNPNHVATIKHIVADGDYVAVHWHYGDDAENEFAGTAWIDLYKIADEKIIEHWDVSMGLRANTASGNSAFSDLYIYPENTFANNDRIIEEENKAMVTGFYLDLFNNQSLSLIEKLVDPSYLQHNVWVANGSDALFDFVSDGDPANLSIFMTLSEGDIVWTFSGSAAVNPTGVDLWRVDNTLNKIVEHWDIF